MSAQAPAMSLQVPATRIHAIDNERPGGIDCAAGTAERLACCFDGNAASWLTLQAKYDQKTLRAQGDHEAARAMRRVAITRMAIFRQKPSGMEPAARCDRQVGPRSYRYCPR